MKRRTRLYISGPLSLGAPVVNAAKLEVIGKKLQDLGYAPFVPRLCPDGSSPAVGTPEYEEFLETDFAWIAVSDAVVRLRGTSQGADREGRYAHSLGIPVIELTYWDEGLGWLRAVIPTTQEVQDSVHQTAGSGTLSASPGPYPTNRAYH